MHDKALRGTDLMDQTVHPPPSFTLRHMAGVAPDAIGGGERLSIGALDAANIVDYGNAVWTRNGNPTML